MNKETKVILNRLIRTLKREEGEVRSHKTGKPDHMESMRNGRIFALEFAIGAVQYELKK